MSTSDSLENIDDIAKIAAYIIKNKITILPTRWQDNSELFMALLRDNYKELFSLNFNDQVYDRIDSTLYDELVKYISMNFDYQIPTKLMNNLNFINYMIDTNPMLLGNYLRNNPNLYDLIDKNILAKIIIKSPLDYVKYYHNDVFLCMELIKKRFPDIFNMQFDDDVFSQIGSDILFDYIIRLTPEIKMFPSILINNKALLYKILKNTYDINLKSSVASLLLDIDRDYASNVILDMVYKDKDTFNNTLFTKINLDILADYIVHNNIIQLYPNLFYFNNQELFNKLLEKKYKNIVCMNFFKPLFEGVQDTILDIFLNGEITSYLDYSSMDIIFNHPKILEDGNLKKLGDYFIRMNRPIYFNAGCMLANRIELFDYLYMHDYPYLFALNFNSNIYKNIPINKLAAYYHKFPQKFPSNVWLKNGDMLKIIDFTPQDIDYLKLRRILIDDAKDEVEIDIPENFSFTLCDLLKHNPASYVYDKYLSECELIKETLILSHEELMSIFEEYQNGFITEENIISLVRKFSSIRKENLIKDMVLKKMNMIKKDYVRTDKKKLITKIKKEKRKQIFMSLYDELLMSDLDFALKINGLVSNLSPELQFLSDELISKIINGVSVNIKPLSYIKKEEIRIINRLNNNYGKIINEIIKNNSEYSDLIIGFLRGNILYDNLRKVIDLKDLMILQEAKNLCMEVNADIEYIDFNIIFKKDIQLSEEDIKRNKEYEQNELIINKIRKLLNIKMNDILPLDKIDVTSDDINSDNYNFDGCESYLDLTDEKLNLNNLINLILIRDCYNNEYYKRIFDKLFIDTYLIYGILFVGNNYAKRLITLANQIDLVAKLFKEDEITLDNLEKIMRKTELSLYSNPSETAILGEDVILSLVFDDTFINDRSVSGRRKRVNDAAKYVSLAGKHFMSTIPFTKVTCNGFTICRFENNDPEILVSGIKTDACFRLLGNDNDFLLYTMFSKNGIVLKILDENGKFIGRISGFRNGNTVYFNQLRTIYDRSGDITKENAELVKKIREAISLYANRLIADTKNTSSPIENVLILKLYGYSDCDTLPTISKTDIPGESYPMDTSSDDYRAFKENPELDLKEAIDGFSTDYKSGYPILVLATTKKDLPLTLADIDEYDVKALYDRPRDNVRIFKNEKITSDVLTKINVINAKYIYWGDEATRSKKMSDYQMITSLDGVVLAVVGEDFYILVDMFGNIQELCLPFDNRTQTIFDNFRQIIIDEYNKLFHTEKVK